MTTYTALSTEPAYPNEGSHDIHFDNGNLVVVTDREAIAQRVRQHIEMYEGEWFLDTSAGVPWFQFIYVEPFDQSTAESILKAAIADVPGVAEITEFMVDIDTMQRSLTLKRVSIRTEFDEEVQV